MGADKQGLKLDTWEGFQGALEIWGLAKTGDSSNRPQMVGSPLNKDLTRYP